MNHLTAVHVSLPAGEGWHYASTNSRGGGPIGFCMEHPPHATETEARECYASYQRGRIKIPADANLASWTDCQECGAPTKYDATWGPYSSMSLCPLHLNVETVVRLAGLDEPAGDAWTS